MADGVLGYARRVLGPCVAVQDCSWEHQLSRVLRLRDEAGGVWYAKRHRHRDRYQAEVKAYRRWAPALGGHAPRLRSCDDALQIILLSPVPGEPAPWPAPAMPSATDPRQAAEIALHRDAGAVLRRLHDAEPPQLWADLGLVKLAEFDQLAPLAAGLLTRTELQAARSQVQALTAVTAGSKVACHHDYTPRNWLAHPGGVSVIDFEWSRLDAPASDLARLHLGIWASRPDLRDAFLDGYGRPLDDSGHAILRGCAVLTAVWLIIKARETAQPAFEHATKTALQDLLATQH